VQPDHYLAATRERTSMRVDLSDRREWISPKPPLKLGRRGLLDLSGIIVRPVVDRGDQFGDQLGAFFDRELQRFSEDRCPFHVDSVLEPGCACSSERAILTTNHFANHLNVSSREKKQGPRLKQIVKWFDFSRAVCGAADRQTLASGCLGNRWREARLSPVPWSASDRMKPVACHCCRVPNKRVRLLVALTEPTAPIPGALPFMHDRDDQHMSALQLIDHAMWKAAKWSLPQVIDEDRPALGRMRDLDESAVQRGLEAARDIGGILVDAVPASCGLRFPHGCGVPS
jgi:hypothetical protein